MVLCASVTSPQRRMVSCHLKIEGCGPVSAPVDAKHRESFSALNPQASSANTELNLELTTA